jgi:hypothetical protein
MRPLGLRVIKAFGFTAAQANGFFSHQGQAGKICPLDV